MGLSLIFDKKVRADIDFYSEWEWEWLKGVFELFLVERVRAKNKKP